MEYTITHNRQNHTVTQTDSERFNITFQNNRYNIENGDINDVWILGGGVWDDYGAWIDLAIWKDN